MKLAVELALIIAINVWGIYAVWWVNRHVDLSALPSRIWRIWLRGMIGLFVWITATAPFAFGLRPIFG